MFPLSLTFASGTRIPLAVVLFFARGYLSPIAVPLRFGPAVPFQIALPFGGSLSSFACAFVPTFVEW